MPCKFEPACLDLSNASLTATSTDRRRFSASLLWALAGLGWAEPMFGRAQPRGTQTLALVGDVIFQRPMLAAVGSQLAPIIREIMRADVAFANFESSGFALNAFRGRHRDPGDGPVVLSPPAAMAELRRMGFDLLSSANNHGFDWYEEGVLRTREALHSAGFTTAGSGSSLAEARMYAVQSSARGTVALVSATTSLTPEGRALNAGVLGSPARAGISNLKLVSNDYPSGRRSEVAIDEMGSDDVRIDPEDRTAVLDEIIRAKRAADVVIFSLHAHQSSPKGATVPPRYEVEIAHAAIDSGADLVAMHVPHQLRGVERYKDGAIFYSLGNFIVMLPEPALNPVPMTIHPGSIFTQPAFFESVVATVDILGGRVTKTELLPIELLKTGNLTTHGTPEVARGDSGTHILRRLQELSEPFGTKFEIDRGRAVVR